MTQPCADWKAQGGGPTSVFTILRDEPVWRTRDKGTLRFCSYCGGIHPEDLIARLKAPGTASVRIERTSKSYKSYVHDSLYGQLKLYHWHLTQPDVDQLNAILQLRK